MKKTLIIKRIFSFLTILTVLIVVCSSITYAEIEEIDITSSLIDRGFPKVYLDNIPDSLKESLYNHPELTFESATISVCNADDGTKADYHITSSGVTQRGQIPQDDLTLTWSIYKISNSNNIKVIYTYKWTDLPFNRYQDPIGISWDNDCFTLVDDSFHKIDQYRMNLSGNYTIGTKSDENAYASASNSGVSWYADLVGYTKQGVDLLMGYGEFILTPKQSNFTTTLYGHYVHSKTPVSLSLSLPVYGASFTVSGSSSYDEIGNQITYTH